MSVYLTGVGPSAWFCRGPIVGVAQQADEHLSKETCRPPCSGRACLPYACYYQEDASALHQGCRLAKLGRHLPWQLCCVHQWWGESAAMLSGHTSAVDCPDMCGRGCQVDHYHGGCHAGAARHRAQRQRSRQRHLLLRRPAAHSCALCQVAGWQVGCACWAAQHMTHMSRPVQLSWMQQ